MLVVWENKTGEARILLPTPDGGGGQGAEMQPLWPAEGTEPEPGLPLWSPGRRVGEPGLTRVSVGGRGRREELEPPAPEGQGYQSTAPSRFPYPGSARSLQYVLLVTHHSFPLLSVCRLKKRAWWTMWFSSITRRLSR